MSRVHPALIELAAGRPLPEVGDAEALVRSAVEHRLAPLLAHQMQVDGRSLGSEADRKLSFEELANRGRSQRMANASRRAVAVLAEHGFEVIVFKGEATAALWWPRPELRPSTDVDLFVNPADMGRLDELVLCLAPDYPNAASLPELALAGSVQWVSFVFDGVTFDIHLDPMNLLSRTRELDRLWHRALCIPLADGTVVRALDPSAALVHWALNQTRDGFPYLVGLVDLRFALADGRLDGGEIRRLVADEGWTSLVMGALRYGCDALGLTPPFALDPPSRRERAITRLLPEESRLCGERTVARARATQWLVQLAAQGRTVESGVRFARRLFQPRSLLARHTDLSGPYLWRLYQHRMRSLRRG